jgi:hypothetical protein
MPVWETRSEAVVTINAGTVRFSRISSQGRKPARWRDRIGSRWEPKINLANEAILDDMTGPSF